MTIQIDGDSLFQIKVNGSPVLRMYFETRSIHSPTDERFALYQFQEDTSDQKAVEEAMKRASPGANRRVTRIGKPSISSEFFGGDRARAEDLLPEKEVKAKADISMMTKSSDTIVVQISAEVGEKKPRIFKLQFQGKPPADLLKKTIQGKAKKITSDLGAMTDIQSDLRSIR